MERRGDIDWKTDLLQVLEKALGPSAICELITVLIEGATDVGELLREQVVKRVSVRLPEPA